MAGWMYRPLEGLCYVAEQGGGAWCNCGWDWIHAAAEG